MVPAVLRGINQEKKKKKKDISFIYKMEKVKKVSQCFEKMRLWQ